MLGNQSRRRETLNSDPLNSTKKIDLVSHPTHAEGLVIHIPTPLHEPFVTNGQLFKVNLNRFEFRVFLLLDQFLYKG